MAPSRRAPACTATPSSEVDRVLTSHSLDLRAARSRVELVAEALELPFAEVESANAFAQRVVELLENPGERERLGRAGRGLVEASYGWPAIVSRLERVYEELLAPSAAEDAQ